MVSPAVAWNAAGHRIIASMAFRQLAEIEQAEVVAMLKKHPRFVPDFADEMPEEVRRGDEKAQNEWLFQQAAVWPDMVRGGPPEKRAFNRSEWHYINLPLFLSDAAKAELEGKLTANVVTDVPAEATTDTVRMNVVQAIRFARSECANSAASPESRAVLLAWLFHTVGDIHQPLHGTAMFSPRLFPEGDRGGNWCACTVGEFAFAVGSVSGRQTIAFGRRGTRRSLTSKILLSWSQQSPPRRCSMSECGLLKVNRLQTRQFTMWRSGPHFRGWRRAEGRSYRSSSARRI